MITRTSIGTLCALFMLLGPARAQSEVTCAQKAEQEVQVQKLNEKIDWFLSIVEEVPEGIATQFREVRPSNKDAFRRAISHPLWYAHKVREEARDLKRLLRVEAFITRESYLKYVITALRRSAWLSDNLSDYSNANRGNRIIDIERWAFDRTILPGLIEQYAHCLVNDLVSAKR